VANPNRAYPFDSTLISPSVKLSPSPSYSAVDQSFIDARARLLDVAAFLDRVQRYGQEDDYRVRALQHAIGQLSTAQPGRVERILLELSDPSLEPIPAATIQGAFGAFKPQS
jgi:hypothetical protein